MIETGDDYVAQNLFIEILQIGSDLCFEWRIWVSQWDVELLTILHPLP